MSSVRRSRSRTPPPPLKSSQKQKDRSKSPEPKQKNETQKKKEEEEKPVDGKDKTLIIVGQEDGGHRLYLVGSHTIPAIVKQKFKQYPDDTTTDESIAIEDYISSIDKHRPFLGMNEHFVNVSEVISFPNWA